MSSDLLAWDRQHLWHPYTSMTDPTPVRLVTSAAGVRLTLADGSSPIDASKAARSVSRSWRKDGSRWEETRG